MNSAVLVLHWIEERVHLRLMMMKAMKRRLGIELNLGALMRMGVIAYAVVAVFEDALPILDELKLLVEEGYEAGYVHCRWNVESHCGRAGP